MDNKRCYTSADYSSVTETIANDKQNEKCMCHHSHNDFRSWTNPRQRGLVVKYVQHLALANLNDSKLAINETTAAVHVSRLSTFSKTRIKKLDTRWHDLVRNHHVSHKTAQSPFSSTIKSQCLSLFGYVECMNGKADANQILFDPPHNKWRKPPGDHTPPKRLSSLINEQYFLTLLSTSTQPFKMPNDNLNRATQKWKLLPITDLYCPKLCI